jgi:hypothetical protein
MAYNSRILSPSTAQWSQLSSVILPGTLANEIEADNVDSGGFKPILYGGDTNRLEILTLWQSSVFQ